MKKMIALFLLLLLAMPLPASDGEGRLPESWYRLPEDGGVNALRDGMPDSRASDNLERLFRSHSSGLDKFSDQSTARGEWSLAALILDLSVSASGAIGVLMAKGEASAALYWRKIAQALEESREESGADLIFTGLESRAEVQTKLEPIIRAVMATGDIKDEAEFRKNVMNVVLGYQSLVQLVSIDPEREWYVSKLRLDFSVDISGKVNPAVTVGGAVRLRFEWEPCTNATVRPQMVKHRGTEEMGKLLETLRQTLQSVSYADLGPTGFKVKSLKFGLGIYGDGKFGVVKVGASVMGHLYLSKKAIFHPVVGPTPQTLPNIPLIEVGEDRGHLEYADATSVTYSTWKYRGSGGTVYQIPTEAFRKGLEKAVKIGTWMAERADRSKGKKWELYLLKTEFALSLAGTVGIVTIGGTGALEIAFDKPSVVQTTSL